MACSDAAGAKLWRLLRQPIRGAVAARPARAEQALACRWFAPDFEPCLLLPDSALAQARLKRAGRFEAAGRPLLR